MALWGFLFFGRFLVLFYNSNKDFYLYGNSGLHSLCNFYLIYLNLLLGLWRIDLLWYLKGVVVYDGLDRFHSNKRIETF